MIFRKVRNDIIKITASNRIEGTIRFYCVERSRDVRPFAKLQKLRRGRLQVKINQLQLIESHQGLNISHQSSII